MCNNSFNLENIKNKLNVALYRILIATFITILSLSLFSFKIAKKNTKDDHPASTPPITLSNGSKAKRV